jgi:hypothetical protein
MFYVTNNNDMMKNKVNFVKINFHLNKNIKQITQLEFNVTQLKSNTLNIFTLVGTRDVRT